MLSLTPDKWSGNTSLQQCDYPPRWTSRRMFPQVLMPWSQWKPAEATHTLQFSSITQTPTARTNSVHYMETRHLATSLLYYTVTYKTTLRSSECSSREPACWPGGTSRSYKWLQKPCISKGHPLVAQLLALWSCTATGNQLWHLQRIWERQKVRASFSGYSISSDSHWCWLHSWLLWWLPALQDKVPSEMSFLFFFLNKPQLKWNKT